MTIENLKTLFIALYAFCTAVAPLFPKGSRIGKFLARIGTDFKGHNE